MIIKSFNLTIKRHYDMRPNVKPYVLMTSTIVGWDF